MNLAQLWLPEIDQEMMRTRHVIAAIPADKMEWKAAESLRTIGWNANHLVEILSWIKDIIEKDVFDLAPVDGPKYDTPNIGSPHRLLELFDAHLEQAKQILAATSDAKLAENWSLHMGGNCLFTIPKADCIRTWVLNHTIHHRGILSVYLRMAGVELTPIYDG